MARPVVFIPRRADKLARTAKLVAERGFEPLPFPLIDYTPLPVKVSDVDGIVVTSSAALRSLPQTKLPLYCVGQATADEAQKLGFNVALTGQGNAAELAEILALELQPQTPTHTLLHPTSADVENTWYAALTSKGFNIKAAMAYEKAYPQELPAEVVCCLTENKVSFTLVFSARSAQALLKLCKAHQLAETTLGEVIAISDKVAAEFNKNNKQLKVRVAKHPQLQEMLNVLEQTPF